MNRTSLALRAALAIGLMVGFYALAFAVAGGLAFLAYEDAISSHPNLRLLVLCALAASSILWSIVPRFDRFQAPGPELDAASQPDLFAEIADIARATGQPMPASVFLVGDINAFVTQRGGIMGIGSQRVMGIGFPLLLILTVPELRAVLAHEFGHFHGGDTRLGPWIYKTRQAIGRTLARLRGGWLRMPFLGYGRIFLLVTNAMSRRQELAADALAARIAGASHLVAGLKKTSAGRPIYDLYFRQTLQPLLARGFLPPIAEGCSRFFAQERIARAMDKTLEKSLEQSKQNPYDSHPPLRDRIAAVQAVADATPAANARPAVSLLADVASVERRWLASVATKGRVDTLQAIAWEAVADRAYLPSWLEAVTKNRAVLDGATIADFVRIVADAPQLAAQLSPSDRADAQAQITLVRRLAAMSTLLALARAGWVLDASPGAAVTAQHQNMRLAPFDLLEHVANGSLSDERWRADADKAGIAALPLVP